MLPNPRIKPKNKSVKIWGRQALFMTLYVGDLGNSTCACPGLTLRDLNFQMYWMKGWLHNGSKAKSESIAGVFCYQEPDLLLL